ncbi:MAG: hypothetical protein KAQ70_07770 [Candidatus Heimdallarchaeota archaeon]|nr:hypothetical protein [Candidatus Heimdallarchaeota archaeon]MCK5142075.1 hypothetical protein [Candidatus Heimdallarchaeota archaeon]
MLKAQLRHFFALNDYTY